MEQELILRSFNELFPKRKFPYKDCSIRYSGKFGSYNANVHYTLNTIQFNLSKDWKEVSDDIKVGLIQHLISKVFKTKKSTNNIDFYNNFIKHLDNTIKKTDIEPYLKESFERVNEKYFFGMIDMPNLRWGQSSKTKLGSYNFHTDTITISKIFQNSSITLLDYIMYHELLHKKLKYKTSKTRTYHHTKEFKKAEKAFENSKQIEKELEIFVNRSRISSKLKKNPILRFFKQNI